MAAVVDRRRRYPDSLRNKAGANGVAEFADFKAVTMRSDGLSIVLDNEKIVLIGDLADRLQSAHWPYRWT